MHSEETGVADDSSDYKRKPTWCRKFPSVGKGTFSFRAERSTPFNIAVRLLTSTGEYADDVWITLAVRKTEAMFLVNLNGAIKKVSKATTESFGKCVGYEPHKKVTYWLSYDRDKVLLKYGKGHRMKETTILTADFSKYVKRDATLKDHFFSNSKERWIQMYDSRTTFAFGEIKEKVDEHVTFDVEPVVTTRSPFVKDSSQANMFDIDRGRYTFSADLPEACQTLYSNVTAPHITLNWAPSETNRHIQLSDAIRHSLQTKDGVLYKKLLEKKERSGGLFSEMYLRVTLGESLGKSPGVPYVLEIWPKGHGSPIHSHGNAYGVIRVLHGGVTVYVYNKDASDRNEEPLLSFKTKYDDVTWLSPNWFQTHKLWNDTDDFCATLQCYQYGEEDENHCPYFEYISKTNQKGQFTPNSDFTFLNMYQLVMSEYKTYLKKKHCKVM